MQLSRGMSKAAGHLLLGVLPMEGHLDRKILSLFNLDRKILSLFNLDRKILSLFNLDRKILSLFSLVVRNNSTSEHEVVYGQLTLKDHSLATCSLFEIMARPHSKFQLKKMVKHELEDFWIESSALWLPINPLMCYLKTQAISMCYLNTGNPLCATSTQAMLYVLPQHRQCSLCYLNFIICRNRNSY